MSFKYSVANEHESMGRYIRKLVAIAHHGAKCFICGEKVDLSKRDVERWQFAHIDPLANPNDKSDRWSGFWRDAQLFTDDWYSFMGRVRLTCSQHCNHLAEGHPEREPKQVLVKHRMADHVDISIHNMKQLDMDFT